MPDELQDAVLRAGDDGAVRVIVLRGAGRAFCAGLRLRRRLPPLGRADHDRGALGPRQGLRGDDLSPPAPVPKFMSIWRVPKPVIAQVHGWCVGGGSDMALCADLVIRDR